MTGVNGNKNFENQEIIVLVDSTISINDIKQIIANKNKFKIITFDLNSHRKLNNQKIQHEISDEYLNKSMQKNIQIECYRMIKWYNEDIIKNNLDFEGINIVKLFTNQFILILIQSLKTFTEMQIIYKKFSNAKFFVGGKFFEIINNFGKNVEKINPHNYESEIFYFDNVETGFKIGKKYVNLKISKNKYNKIKNMGEKILQFSVGAKGIDKNQKATLIVEFNTENFESLFLEGGKSGKKLLFYGIRRPAIWNKNSYNIIKNSGCKIITSSSLLEEEFHSIVSENTKMIKEKFLIILNDNVLKDFFSINNTSIWFFIKNKILDLIEKNIDDVIIEILQAKNLFKNYSIDSVLVISEAGSTEQIVTKFAKDLKIPILHLQEGLHYDTSEAYNNVKSQGVFPELADQYIVWGENYKTDALQNGKVKQEKIIMLGSPQFNNLSFDSTDNDEKYVLLATMPPQIEEINGINVLKLEEYTEAVIRICKIISKHRKKIIIKLHPTFDILKLSEIIEEQFSEIEVITKGNINPLIRSCSELIVTGLSTVMLQGQILQKPVISIPIIDYDWGIPTIYKSKSCIVSTVDSLEEELVKLQNQEYRTSIIVQGNKFVKLCLINTNTASQKLWKHIQKLQKM